MTEAVYEFIRKFISWATTTGSGRISTLDHKPVYHTVKSNTVIIFFAFISAVYHSAGPFSKGNKAGNGHWSFFKI